MSYHRNFFRELNLMVEALGSSQEGARFVDLDGLFAEVQLLGQQLDQSEPISKIEKDKDR